MTASSPYPAPGSIQTFRSSVVSRIFSLISGALIGTAVALGVTKLLIDDRLGVTDQPTLITIFFVLTAVFIGVTTAQVFFVRPVRIVVSASSVELWRGLRKRQTWARDATRFSSFVVRTTTNGVRTGSTRKLIAVSATARDEIQCTWFRPKTFNALIAELAPVTGSRTTPAVPPPAGFRQTTSEAGIGATTGSFTVDHSFMRRSRAAVAIIAAVGGTLVAVLLTAGGYPGTWAIVTGGGCALLVLVFLVPLSLQNRSMPRTVEVTPSTLQIDNRVFMIDDLASVAATPANYSGAHNIVLRDRNGRITKIRFGAVTNKTFPDYGRLVNTVAAATAHRPGLFTLNVA